MYSFSEKCSIMLPGRPSRIISHTWGKVMAEGTEASGSLPQSTKNSNEFRFYDKPTRTDRCWGFGPLEIFAEVKGKAIYYEVRLCGFKIADGELTRDHAEASVEANVEIAKAKLALRANFDSRQLLAEGEVCIRKWDGWECRGFSEVILVIFTW